MINKKFKPFKYLNTGSKAPFYCPDWEKLKEPTTIYGHEGALNAILFDQHERKATIALVDSGADISPLIRMIQQGGHKLVMIPDNDKPGRELAERIRKAFFDTDISERLSIYYVEQGVDFGDLIQAKREENGNNKRDLQ